MKKSMTKASTATATSISLKNIVAGTVIGGALTTGIGFAIVSHSVTGLSSCVAAAYGVYAFVRWINN